ncbi:MAG: phosphoglycerate kinase [Flavobacteriia bacterium]|nr:phosphoglycerate kinase [Flavobacteriia bacterium]NDD19465.1 phosphoglycerate kinase [Flavobacteriia bacterium]NDD80176.1 phosphoglycerate kinase [Flavobacteriia bacterium]
MKTIENLSLSGQRALVRVDFNVPLTEEGQVANDKRILATLPTITYLADQGAKVILLSHLGRPKAAPEAKYSLRPVAEALAVRLGRPVGFCEEAVGPKAEAAVSALGSGDILLLENVRFYPGEERGDADFAAQLAKHGDCYVNDAFGTAHRAHSSTTIVAQHFPGKCAFGYVMAAEIENVNRVLQSSERPALAIVGGSKVSSKIDILQRLMDRVDHIIIGGGMSFTFIKAQGGEVGQSICELDHLQTAREIMSLAEQKGVTLHLPSDVLAADDFSPTANTQICSIFDIPAAWQGLDAGPESIKAFIEVVQKAKTLLWNGPLGVFEMEAFAGGTREVGEAIAEATERGLFSLVGGGDSVSAVEQFGLSDRMSYISTGGGAMLEYLEGKTLPGIQAILDFA